MSMMISIYKKISDKLLVLLSDALHVSFTTDFWSSSVAPMALLSLTTQWIDSSFALRRATLHVQEFRGSHSTERIKQSMEKMLNNWGIENQRVHIILRDNAANMKKAMRDITEPLFYVTTLLDLEMLVFIKKKHTFPSVKLTTVMTVRVRSAVPKGILLALQTLWHFYFFICLHACQVFKVEVRT